MEQIPVRKTLDKYLPRWAFYIILTAAIFFANYFNNMSAIYNTLSVFPLTTDNVVSLIYITNVILVLVQVAIFEFVARIYYNYVSNRTQARGLLCSKMQFVDTLRVFYIFRCIVLGCLYILVYAFPYLVYFASNVFNLLVSSIFYYLFFLYIKDKFINKRMGARTFIHLAIPFLIYSALVLFINFVF